MSQIFVSPFVRATQGSGAIAGGAFLYFYLSGTTTPATVYADSALTTELPSPVPANAFGVFPNIFLNPDTIYRVVEKTATGAVLGFDADPVYGQDPSAAVNAAAIVAETERAEGVESDLNVRLTTAEGDIDVLQTNVAAFQGTITSGRRAYGTYASAVSDAATPVIYPAVIAGTVAEVPLTDAGTHTDPVVGGTVNNSGVFRWSVSPAGWRRMYDIDAAAAQTYSTLAGHFANDSTDVQVPGQGDTAARGSQYWSITSGTSATLAGHFANDSTDVQVPGQADTAARGAKYWSIQAAALASGQTIGLVLPSLPVPADIFAEFFDNKYYFQGYTYIVFTSWVTGTTGTFTRGGSDHRYINSSGLRVNGSANAARFTYDPTTTPPTALGLLYEPSATQLFSDSSAINTATWHFVLSAATTTDNAATGPDGTTSAGSLIETTANAQHYMWYRDPTLTITSGLFYAFQVWIKAAGRSKIRINPSTDMGLGVVTLDLVAKTVSDPTYTLEQWPNGWFRLWKSSTATATAIPNIRYYLLDSSGLDTYTGDGTSGAYFGGAQLEAVSAAGKPPTSYILRTGSSAAVRSPDALQMTLPSTVSNITYVFSDGTQQIIPVASGSYTVPTSLSKAVIRSLISVDLSVVGSPVTSVFGRIGAVTGAQADIAGLTVTSTPTFNALITTAVSSTFGGAKFRNDVNMFQWTIGGPNLSNAFRGIIIGATVASSVTTWANSIAIGNDAAHAALNISTAVVIGDTAGGSSPLVSGSNLIGNEAGNGPSISGSNIIGNLSRCGFVGATVTRSEVMGQNGMLNNGCVDSVVIGQSGGLGVGPTAGSTINQSVMIGSQVGKLSGGATITNLILIGYNIQAPTATTSNYISIGDAFIQNSATGATKIQKAGGGRALFSLPGLAASTSYANDAAAAAGGVAVDEFYRNGSAVQVRVV